MYPLKLSDIKKRQILSCLSLIFVTLLFLTGCSADEPNLVTKFSISVKDVADFSAEVLITHDGTNRDNYYVFTVKGENINITDEIRKHHDSIQSSSSATPYDQKKRIVKLSGLAPESDYTCIIYGIDESGDPTGISASTLFKTTDTKIIFEENPNWVVCYCGQGFYKGATYSQVSVYVEGNVEERYFIRIYDKATVDGYPDLRDFIIYVYNDFVNERNELGDEYFWMEDNFVRTESTDYYEYLHKGTYQAFAIGVDYMGNITGHYAVSDVFEFDKYELDPDYEYLLGDWVISDEVGGEIYVTFSEKWANSTFTLSGWGNNDCPFEMIYNLFSIEYALELNFQNVLGKTWGDDSEKPFSLEGWYSVNDNLKLMSYTSNLAYARKNEDGSYTFRPRFSKTLSSGEKAENLGVVVTYTDSDGFKTYYNSSKLQFPFTMRKI